MRGSGVGHIIFALAIAGLGVLGLATGHFAAVWQPVPAHLPARLALAYANGVLMLALGTGLFIERTRGLAAIGLTGYFLIWFFLLHGPEAVAAPLVAHTWSAFGENGTLIVGGLMLVASGAAEDSRRLPAVFRGASGVNLARTGFAFAAFLMSLGNLAYPAANANFPPAWIPHWNGWGYLVGCAYIATGLSILLRVAPRLSTSAAAAMMSLFTVLGWGSFVVRAPASRMNWTALLISSALTGAGWMVAGSYRDHPWLSVPWLQSTSFPRNQAGNPESSS